MLHFNLPWNISLTIKQQHCGASNACKLFYPFLLVIDDQQNVQILQRGSLSSLRLLGWSRKLQYIFLWEMIKSNRKNLLRLELIRWGAN